MLRFNWVSGLIVPPEEQQEPDCESTRPADVDRVGYQLNLGASLEAQPAN
jgi:hypothetical protein